MTDDIQIIREALAAGPTPGPWQVVSEEIPHLFGGKHIERRIFTTWKHPQLQGEAPVVNHSIGVGKAKGEPAAHLVQIDEQDAAYIAACSPDRMERLLARLEAAETALALWEHAYESGCVDADLAAAYKATP